MNKLVLSALAATVAMGTTYASEGEWAGLDAELNTLTTALDNHGGPSVSGYLEAGYNTDTEEWGTGRNRVAVSGDNGGYGYHVSLQGSEGADAYVTFTMGGMGWTMGTFMAPGTAADAECEGERVFSTRNATSDGVRSDGLMTSGSMDNLGYQIHIGDGNEFSARVSYDVMSGDGMNLSVAYSMDDAADTSAIEADVSSGPFGIHVTMADEGGTDPMIITASYDVNGDWGVHIRQTDLDDGSDETLDWALVYGDGGARWTIESLDDGADAVTIGCLVGF